MSLHHQQTAGDLPDVRSRYHAHRQMMLGGKRQHHLARGLDVATLHQHQNPAHWTWLYTMRVRHFLH